MKHFRQPHGVRSKVLAALRHLEALAEGEGATRRVGRRADKEMIHGE
jgi:hypothetical protein